MNLIHPSDLECFAYSTEEIIEFTILVNKLNIDKLIPLFEQCVPKNQLDGFLLCEHVMMSRQFRVVTILLQQLSMLNFDGVDLCLSIVSLTRSIIENMAIINFLIHDTTCTEDLKVTEIKNFQDMGKNWAATNSYNLDTISVNERVKMLDKFFQAKRKEINKSHIWNKIGPDNLTKLIKTFKFTDDIYENEHLYNVWDSLSKLLHNNLLHRLALFANKDNKINLNYDTYACYLDEAILTLSNLFLKESLNYTVKRINDSKITEIYEDGILEISNNRYNKKINKLY